MNPNRLRTDGYYSSGPVLWEDWHAGVHMSETHYHYWRFFENRDFVCCYRYVANFDFWTFSKTLPDDLMAAAKRGQAPLNKDGLPMLSSGVYEVADGLVIVEFQLWIPLHPAGSDIDRSSSVWRIAGDRLEPLGTNRAIGELSFRSAPS